jgi:hypothetical protein
MAHGAWSIEFKNKKAPIPSCGSQSAERIAIKHLETKSSNPLVVRIAHSAESIAKIKRKKEPHPSYPRDGAQSSVNVPASYFTCFLGRGTPLPVNLYPRAPNCQGYSGIGIGKYSGQLVADSGQRDETETGRNGETETLSISDCLPQGA